MAKNEKSKELGSRGLEKKSDLSARGVDAARDNHHTDKGKPVARKTGDGEGRGRFGGCKK